jgi:hypothetical protein
MIALWIILLALVSALFYRLGGMGGYGRSTYPNVPGWVFDTKARDLGCPLVALGAMFVMGIANVVPWWINLISFLLCFGALTTYWDSVPFNKGKDNFYMHGAGIAIAYLPYIVGVGWVGPVVRVVVLTVAMGVYQRLVGKDWLDEGGRGFLIVATLPLLLI